MPSISEDGWLESNVDDLINYLGDQQRRVMEVAESDIPTQARRWLERINETGGLPQRGWESRQDPKSLVPGGPGNPRLARLDNGQTVWLGEGKRRSPRGYKTIEVLEKPSREDAAILAMLTVLEGRRIRPERVRELLDKGAVPSDEWEDFEVLKFYANALLRYLREDYESLPQEERIALIEGTCARIYEFLEALHKLLEFLEYGTADRDLRLVVENAARDVKAAVLKDVDGLTLPEIAEGLDVPLSCKARAAGDYSTVSKMVKRGRGVLERAWGEDGWRKKAEAMKAEAESWNSLAPEERFIKRYAEALDVSPEKAQRMILDEQHGEKLDERQRFILTVARFEYIKARQQG